MIINNTFGFIFVHVPKAAGTTLTSVLSKHGSYCDIEIGGTAMGEAVQPFFRKRYGLTKHSTIREIRNVVGDALLKRYFTFAFVRNPYDRAYSAYKFLSRVWAEKQLKGLSEFARFHNFFEFVASKYFQGPGLDRMLMPQTFWISGDSHPEKIAVDYVGKVENLDACLREICERIGGGMEKKRTDVDHVMPVLNKSSEPGNAVWLELDTNPDIEEVLYKRYASDFKAFDYPRLLNARQAA